MIAEKVDVVDVGGGMKRISTTYEGVSAIDGIVWPTHSETNKILLWITAPVIIFKALLLLTYRSRLK